MSRRRPWRGDDSLDADAWLTERIRRERGRDTTNAYGDIEDFMEAAILETDEDRIERTRAAGISELERSKLPPRQVEAWKLYGQGLSLRQVGERMGLHRTTVRELLQSAISSDITLEEMRQRIQAAAERVAARQHVENASRLLTAIFPLKRPGQGV
jgi:DNA-binding NarL/FixJ family response regulator